MSNYRLFLLDGKLRAQEVHAEGDEVVTFGSGQIPVGIVVGLATQAGLKAVAATSLRTLCYDDIPPERWKEGIHQAVSRLRRSKGLPVAEGDYRLELDLDDVDILRFERLAQAAIDAADPAGTVAVADTALALWKKDPDETFADFPLLTGIFARFTKLHRRVLRARAKALSDLERFSEALAQLEDAVQLYPDDALLQQQHGEARELVSAQPGDDVTRRRRAVRHNLPAPEDRRLIGRDEAVARVFEDLLPYPRSQYPTLTVDGVGGVGKTALVKRIAYMYVDMTDLPQDDPGFAAIVWTSAKRTVLGEKVSVVQPTLRNLEDIYSEIATTLGRVDLLAAPPDEHDRLIRQLLSDPDSRILLIVDNLETVDDERVVSFLRDCPAPTKRLITTRHRLEAALQLRLEGLQPGDAEHLARETALQRQLELPEDVIADIAKAAGGIPLAIIWTVSLIAKTHDAQRALLRLRSASGDYAQFCFRDSLHLLQAQGSTYEVELLFAMSLFAEDASREALGHVCRMNERPAERDAALSVLTDLSLANFQDGRYSLLPLTKSFVGGELGRDLNLQVPAVDRWLDWHRQLTSKAASGGADLDSKLLSLLRREHTNILWGIDFSMRDDRADDFVALVRSMEFFWLGEGLWAEFEHYLNRARTLAPRPEDKIHFTGRLMWLHVLRDSFEEAEEMRQAAELLLRRFDVPYERMRLEDFTGQMWFSAGQLDKAEEHLKESLSLARRLQDRRGQFACLKYLGELSCERGDAHEARVRLEAAEQFVGDPGDVQWLRGLAHTAHLQGRIDEVIADWAAAETAYRECLRLLGFHPDARLATRAQEGLARALYNQGRLGDACEELDEVRRTYERLGMWKRAEATHGELLGWSS